MAALRATVSNRAAGVALVMLCAGGLVHASHARAQSGCDLGDGSQRFRTEPDPRGGSITRLTTPHFECDDDVEIWADSATAYQYDAMSILYGSVRYRDRDREMRADNARYFSNLGRLQAQGNVLVTNAADGSVVRNGDLVYLRRTDRRAIEEMTFTTGADGLRPSATVYPKRPPPAPVDTLVGDGLAPDSLPADTLVADPIPPEPEAPAEPAEPAEPEQYIMVGDRRFFRGDSYFNATGSVEIQRDSLFAYADSADYEGDRGELLLAGSARVESNDYDLVGRTITMASAADGTDVVRAVRDAVLTGEELHTTAPQIVLYLADGELERMVAIPLATSEDEPAAEAADAAPRPYAVWTDTELTGDSLDVAAPGGVIQRIFAAGKARSVSSSRNELNVESLPDLALTDWMDADTIEVLLVPVTADSADTADAENAEYEVERIIARVSARSLYRLVPSDSTSVPGVDPPAVSYQVADQITVFMVDGQADRVESIGQVSGWHLEPLPPAPPDSTTVEPAPAPTDTPAQGPPAGVGGDLRPLGAYFSRMSSPREWRSP
jgi:lipopolysaccharide export system protein LptA